MSGGKLVKGIVIIGVAAAVLCGGMAYRTQQEEKEKAMQAHLSKYENIMLDGVSVNGIDVSGMTYDEALKKVSDKMSVNDDAEVNVTVGERGFSLGFDEAGAEFDVKSAVDEAFAIGRNGSVKERYKAAAAAEEKGIDISVPYSYDEKAVEKFAAMVKAEADCEKADSIVTTIDGRFTVTDEVIGIDVDEALTLDMIKAAFAEGKTAKVEAVYTVDMPEITKADNEVHNALIGTYETSFSRNQINRNINLEVGCNYINGTILQPGEEFSTATALKDQTYENGYRAAAVFVDGKSVDGMGGGVCQISTTIYNAVIRAELDVTQRMNHSLAVGYVPLGLDAAIADGYKDFKFVNSTDYPIYIETYIEDYKIIANIYGYEEHTDGREVKFESVYMYSIPKPAEKVTEDPEKEEGFREVTYEGQLGHVVQVYKKVYENGELISREFMTESRYRSVADEVTIGTKPVGVWVPPTPPEEEEKPVEVPAEPLPEEEEKISSPVTEIVNITNEEDN